MTKDSRKKWNFWEEIDFAEGFDEPRPPLDWTFLNLIWSIFEIH